MRKRILCLVLFACGGSAKVQPERYPPVVEPAWAKDYERLALAGCDCADAACLENTHAELAAIEKRHGGLDEAPPSVHKAHGQFDKCWREGTRDLARDLEHGAQAVCTCTTLDCLHLARIELSHLVDGKYRETFEADVAASPRATAAAQRASDCLDKVVMPAAEALAMFDRVTTAMCACTNLDCVSAVYKMRAAAMGNYLDIDQSVEPSRVREFTTTFCGCMEKAAADSIKQMSPVPSLTSVDIHMKCN